MTASTKKVDARAVDADGGRRLSHTVSSALLSELTSGAYQPGERLPPEREIATRFGVSRTVIREAMQVLLSRGVVTVRPGAGIFVGQGHAAAATESIKLLVGGSPEMSYERVHEVREAIEVRVVELAAERADESDFERLREALTRLDSAVTGEEFALSDGDFHLVLAALSHNPLFRVLLEAIGDLMVEVRRQSAYMPGARERITADHRRIAEAIERRDARAANEAMDEHLSHSCDIVRALDDTLRRSRRESGGTGTAPTGP